MDNSLHDCRQWQRGEDERTHFYLLLWPHTHFIYLQNLLRTLTESQAKPTLNPDLRLLLTTVKEGRVCNPSVVLEIL